MEFITFFNISIFSVYKCLLLGFFNIYYELALMKKVVFIVNFETILSMETCCVEISVC